LLAAGSAGGVACAASAGANAPATLSAGGQTRHIDELQAAQLLFAAGRLADAKKVLLDLRKARPNDPEVLFLLGSVAVAQKDYPSAIHLFRLILVRRPGAVRVRLELGRAFFLAKDYDNAERQFRFALAGRLPPAVRANVQRYLYVIRLSRTWSYNLSVSLAPDTDLNAGPSIQTVSLFGLPFELSKEAQRKSGVGVTVDAGGEWSPRVSRTLWLRAGAQLDTSDYPDGAFDDTTLSGYAGVRFISGKWDVSPLATYFRRWYGGHVYNDGAGASLQATYYVTQRVALSGALTGQYVSFGPPPGQSGPALSASLGALYTLSPTSFVSGQISVAREWAEFGAYANTAVQLKLGYYRDLPAGFSVSVGPSWTRVAYDARLAAFPVARVDNQWGVEATVLNRRIDIAGFTPRLAYTYTLNRSDLPLYAYDRNRFELGFTRAF
ncbi:MAG: surface lipoprotein assembly modifier, partial [Caulobacteraceae bacterium]